MPEQIRPTKKQRELLEYVQTFIGQYGYSPSYREIMSGAGYNSVATVAEHVQNLISRGHLRKRDHSARSLEVVNHQQASEKAATITEPSPAVAHGQDWLIHEVEQRFVELEKNTETVVSLDALSSLVSTLEILGITAAPAYRSRLASLLAAQTQVGA